MPEAKTTGAGVPGRRFKPYSAYKDSGVEWLGKIPAHWEVKPFKALLSKNDSGVWGEDFADDGVVVLRSTEQTVDGRWKIQDPARRRLTAREASNGRLGVGDLVATKSSGSDLHIGKTSIVDETVAALKCCFSNFMQRLRVAPPHEPRHYWYLLNCPVLREQLVFLSSTTTGLGNLNGSILGALRVPLAPESEQRAIAAFLDGETAKIDALVAKKERLIELLQEKRTALITRAVTKGLDPNVPVKHSGVEWLGEIPAHWEVMPIRSLARPGYRTFVDGDWIESPFIRDEGIRLVQTGNVGIGAYKEQGFRYIDDETFRAFRCTEVLPGDVLICRLADPVGRACVAPDLGCRMITSVDVCILKTGADVDAAFVVYALSGGEYLSWMSGICRGGTRDRVSRSMLGSIRVQKPPLHEQQAIAAFLDRETAKLDALVAKVRDATDRLKELRTALVSAAVTGKIYVREHAA